MIDNDNVIDFRRTLPPMVRDNIGNREAAMELVSKLIRYYHSQGRTWVKVWLEPETLASGSKMWNIRSNIVFKVPTIERWDNK